MSRKIELNRILSNNRSGSTEILDKLNNWFSIHRFSDEEYKTMFKNFLIEFSEFRNIEVYLKYCLNILNRKGKNELIEYFKKYENDKKFREKILIEKSIKYLSKYSSFLTISNSQTLQAFFIALSHVKRIKVIISEGRPILEGRILAKNLSRYNIEVSLITEAMIADAMKDIDVVLIGADKVLPDGSLVNKVGSRPLAICAKYFKKPFFVIAGNNKFSEKNIFTVKKKPRKEIWVRVPPKVNIENYYFEIVENKLIKKIITN